MQFPTAVLSRASLFVMVFYHATSQVFADYLTLLHTVTQKVGAGNFTYYELHDRGAIRLVLETTSGDADLYISDSNQHPDWEDYELNSVTCGEDIIDVPLEMKRPVYIGVYGYHGSDLSQYNLFIYQLDTKQLPVTSYTGQGGSNKKHYNKPGVADPKENEESLLWNIFVGLLKILFDVLV